MRALRRHHRQRMIARAARLWKEWRRPFRDFPVVRRLAHEAQKYADNMKICSCYQCANRRRFEGPTWRERLCDGGEE